jgi:hypothetical protein
MSWRGSHGATNVGSHSIALRRSIHSETLFGGQNTLVWAPSLLSRQSPRQGCDMPQAGYRARSFGVQGCSHRSLHGRQVCLESAAIGGDGCAEPPLLQRV